MLSFENSSSKASSALHFCSHQYGSCPPFKYWDTHFRVPIWGLVGNFSVVKHLKNWLGKLASKSVDIHYTRFWIWEKNRRAYLCVSVIQASFSLYFTYTLNNLIVCSCIGWAERQTIIQTYKLTHTFFGKQTNPVWFKNYETRWDCWMKLPSYFILQTYVQGVT